MKSGEDMIWKKIAAGLLLGLLGFAVNWFRIDLFFNIQFLFGSIFVMFAIMHFGATAGIVAGFIASLCTWVLWKHPWAVAIMTLEAIFVSLLYRKKIRNLPVCDLLYWLLAGSPSVFLFYSNVLGLQADETMLVFLKQSINGICNAIIANILYILFGRCASKKQETVPLRHLLFLTISFAALFPPAFFMILNFQEARTREMERLANEVGRLSDISKDTVDDWIHDNIKNVQTLARLIGDPDAAPVERMQQLVDVIKAASPQFVRMGVMNRDGVSVAYSPQKDKAGNSTIGLDFSDRPYMPTIKSNPKPYIGDVVVSRTLPAEYDLPLIARFPGPEFKGYCGGVVNVAQIRDLFVSLIGDRQMDLILLDRNGRVIIGTRRDVGIMAAYDHPSGTPENIEGTNARLWTPFFSPRATLLHRWHGSVISAERILGPELGWKIVAEASLHPLVKTLSRRSARELWAMWGLVIFIVPLTYFISRTFSQSTARLQDIVAKVPSSLPASRDIDWPKSRIYEIDQLEKNLKEMIAALKDSFQRQKALSDTLEQKVAERTAQLDRRNREMEQFVYAASHDLQEPLRSVVGFLQLLQSRCNEQLDEKGRHYIERSVRAGKRMQALIIDLLDLARVDTKGGSFEYVDLDAIVENTVENLRPIILEKGAAVVFGKMPGIRADANQIQRVFQNLISNALKYNENVEPNVEIGCRDDSDKYQIHVRDNGIGISSKYHEKIFLVFQRLHTEREYPGTGMGLAICKKIVERHNGTMWVESEPGEGATFYFTIVKN